MKTQAPNPVKPLGLRERNKARRRDAILDSVLRILRTSSISDLSVERIAELAKVSPATVYNLVGTRDALFIACIDRVIENLAADLADVYSNDDPVPAALAIVETSAQVFINNGDAFRQILRAVNSASHSGQSLAMDPGLLQIRAMKMAQAQGFLSADVDAAALGRQVYLSYNGAMFAWSAGQLDNNGFLSAVRHGLWTALAAAATEEHRPVFVQRMIKASQQLSRAGYGQSSKRN
jgi:AcrR family transcriptional regulator